MYREARKLHLIEAILKIENDAVLQEVEKVITKNKLYAVTNEDRFKELSGIWTNAEAEEMKRVIEESCGQINPNDWK